MLLEWETTSPDSDTQEFYYWELTAWEVHPQTVANWTSQPTTHGLNGFQHIREVWLPYNSQGGFTFTIVADNKPYSYPVASSNGKTVKVRFDTDPIKGKLFSYGTSGVPTTIFLEDMEVRIKEWSSTGPFLPIKPFAA